jgi:hypothetical protein
MYTRIGGGGGRRVPKCVDVGANVDGRGGNNARTPCVNKMVVEKQARTMAR